MTSSLQVRQLLERTIGLEVDSVGEKALQRAVRATLARHGGMNLAELLAQMSVGGPVLQELAEDILVPETWFFRDRGPYECLGQYARAFMQERQKGVLRVLSAACSTGEEPFSIVMTLLEAGLGLDRFIVDAADISRKALKSAQEGIFTRNSFREDLFNARGKYFEESGERFILRQDIVRKVNFSAANLVDPHFAEGRQYEVIFCRNVLIYLSPAGRESLSANLRRLLLAGGLLFAGHSECLCFQGAGFEPVEFPRGFVLSKPFLAARTSSAGVSLFSLGEHRFTPGGQGFSLGAEASSHLRWSPRASRPGGPTVPGPERERQLTPGETPALPGKTPALPGKNAAPEAPAPRPRIDPDIERLLEEARSEADRGGFERAGELCRQAADWSPCDPRVHFLLAVVRHAAGAIPEAESLFLRTLYLDPGHYEALIHLSLLYEHLGEFGKAEHYRERAARSLKSKGGVG